jgi:tRNA(Ile2) C34 agmatinyltransferase TiaS
MSIFPNGRHDDQVDQTTQALHRLHSGLSYGWTVFLQRASEIGTEEFEMVNRTNRTNQRAAVKVDKPKACPRCQATCIAPVCSGGFRCGQCGEQFEAPPREKHHQTRGEYLAR